MRTTLVVPGLASGGPMVTSAARCDVLPRVLKKFFHARAFVRSFAFDVERRGDESDGCSYIITRYVCMFLHARCGTIARIRQRARLRHRERARETPSRAEPSRAESAFANARFAFDVQYMYLHRFDVGALSVSSSSTSLLVSAWMSRSTPPVSLFRPTNCSRSSAMRSSM